jgi:hypothetical protein
VLRGIAPDGPITQEQRDENLRANQQKMDQINSQGSKAKALATAATSNYLGVHHSAESVYYYCGPAAVRSALLQRGVDVTQTPLANQMHTTSIAGTAWIGINADVPNPSGRPVRDVLNQREPGSWNYAAKDVANHTSASQATYRSNLTFDVNANHALVIAVYEKPGEAHLTGHPSGKELWHYVSARGYSDSGANTGIDDPVSGSPDIPWQGDVPAQSEQPTSKLFKMMEPHGGQGAYGYVL